MAISIANAAALVRLENGVIGEARIAMGALAPTVMRCPDAEAFLIGKTPTLEALEAAARLIESAICPIDDVRATAAYRRAVAVKLAERALRAALPVTAAQGVREARL